MAEDRQLQEEGKIEVGDTIQIMDKEENTTIVPKAKVTEVDTAIGADGEDYTTLRTDQTGEDWYSEEHHSFVILESAAEPR